MQSEKFPFHASEILFSSIIHFRDGFVLDVLENYCKTIDVFVDCKMSRFYNFRDN